VNTFNGLDNLKMVYFVFQLLSDVTLTNAQQGQILTFQENYPNVSFKSIQFSDSSSLFYSIHFGYIF